MISDNVGKPPTLQICADTHIIKRSLKTIFQAAFCINVYAHAYRVDDLPCVPFLSQ